MSEIFLIWIPDPMINLNKKTFKSKNPKPPIKTLVANYSENKILAG